MRYFATTHQGKRKLNQDYYAVLRSGRSLIACVADGCGAYEGSELAASSFCEALVQGFPLVKAALRDNPELETTRLIDSAQNAMAEELRARNFSLAATTCAIAISLPDKLITAHVGDSRIYRLTDNELWHSKDHSQVQQLIDAGTISEADAYKHPEAHILTQAMDSWQEAQPSISVQSKFAKGERILLCTDGLWGEIKEKQIHKLLQSPRPKMMLQKTIDVLIEHSFDNDNITAVLIY